jgi:hypothetical protein
MPQDPFVAMASGRCLFRYEDLLKLRGAGDGTFPGVPA